MSRANKFRVGQTVQWVYDPAQTFAIDTSVVPERTFNEKDSDRCWTRSELQHLGVPEKPYNVVPAEWQTSNARNAF